MPPKPLRLLPVGRPSKNISQLRYWAQQVFFDEDVVSQDDVKEIVKKAVEQAKDGNPQAREFVAAYRFGKPKPMDENTSLVFTPDGDVKVVTMTDDQLEALVALGHAPAIEDVTPPNADQVVDADYRVVPGPSGSDR